MATNAYEGICDWCGVKVPPCRGDFQSIGSLPKDYKKWYTGLNYKGRWLIRCFNCRGTGNETIKIKNLKQQGKI